MCIRPFNLNCLRTQTRFCNDGAEHYFEILRHLDLRENVKNVERIFCDTLSGIKHFYHTDVSR